jgi:hypothetical protein
MRERPTLFPFGRADIAAGERAQFELRPQVPMKPRGLRFGRNHAAQLAVVALQVGQISCLASAGGVPATIFEEMDDPFEAPICRAGYVVLLEVANLGRCSLSVEPLLLALTVDQVQRTLAPSQHPGWMDALDIPEVARPRYIASGGGGGASAAPGISIGGGGGAAPVPAPLCGSRRPDSGEKCRQSEQHAGDHFDGLAQSWPQLPKRAHGGLTPSRRELEEIARHRERYLDDADGWNAWQSPTDES